MTAGLTPSEMKEDVLIDVHELTYSTLFDHNAVALSDCSRFAE